MRYLLLLLSLILLPGIAHAEKRVALVIGNSKYKHAGELTNPKNDAAGMTAALKKVNDSSEFREFMANRGFGVRWADGAGFASFMDEGNKAMGVAMKAAGLAKG